MKAGEGGFGEKITKEIEVKPVTSVVTDQMPDYFVVYPKPVTVGGDIFIKGSFNAGDKVVVYNIEGKKVFETRLSSSQSEISIDSTASL